VNRRAFIASAVALAVAPRSEQTITTPWIPVPASGFVKVVEVWRVDDPRCPFAVYTTPGQPRPVTIQRVSWREA
jgi:hypothetical protein